MTAQALLTVAAVLFSLGLFCVITRRNAVSILMGVELILNAANINLVTFSNYLAPGAQGGPRVPGHLLVVFVVLLAAAEAAVALAIVLALFRRMGTVEVDRLDSLRE